MFDGLVLVFWLCVVCGLFGGLFCCVLCLVGLFVGLLFSVGAHGAVFTLYCIVVVYVLLSGIAVLGVLVRVWFLLCWWADGVLIVLCFVVCWRSSWLIGFGFVLVDFALGLVWAFGCCCLAL